MTNIYNLIDQHRQKRSCRIAVIDGDNQYTYGDLLKEADAVAESLVLQGVKPGDRVGVHFNKSIEEIIAIFAVARIGAISVNMNYRFKTTQCGYILKDCLAGILLTDQQRARTLSKQSEPQTIGKILMLDRGTLSVIENQMRYERNDGAGPHVESNNTGNLATILYTSGSTGMPKGVMVSHQMLIKGAEIVSGYLNNHSNDRLLSLVPLSFDYGLNQLISMCLLGGAIVLQKTAIPSAVIDTIISKQITGMAAVPNTWIEMTAYLEQAKINLPSLRYITNTGGKIPGNVLRLMPTLFQGVDIYLMYGFTEAFRSTFLPPERFYDKCGSIGKSIPGVEIFVVDQAKGLCAANETGELLHSGALISSGYWGSPEATRKKIGTCPHLKHLIGDRPVAYSGDLVFQDNDGFIWFVGRMDDMIKSSGYRISPTEVEESAYTSGMVGCAVAFGVDDLVRGQVIYLAVTTASPDCSVEGLMAYCCERLPSYMVPELIFIWPGKMPKTSNGKIDRKKVIETLQKQYHSQFKGQLENSDLNQSNNIDNNNDTHFRKTEIFF